MLKFITKPIYLRNWRISFTVFHIFWLTAMNAMILVEIKAQSLIINHHDIAAFDSIPDEYKSAAADTRMLFMDRSVGYNISTFLDCLSEPWSDAPSYCKRYGHMDSIYAVDPSEVYWNGTWNRSNWRYAFWPDGCSEDVNCFIDYMEDRLDSFDVMGCQFSYLAVLPGSKIADTVTGFFGDQGSDNKASTYLSFEADHPDKRIIWWTTSLARGIGTSESEAFNDQMREYANSHDIILFDVADILSHDPAGLPCYDNRDGVTYKDESHPNDGLDIPAICPRYTTETEGGHLGSISAGGIRVAKAFWVLMARMAGWKEEISSVKAPLSGGIKILPNPAKDYVTLVLENLNHSNDVDVVIHDLAGRLLLHTSMHSHGGDHQLEIDVSHLTQGVYIVRAGDHHQWYVAKLLIR